jgi:hypothetical protein
VWQHPDWLEIYDIPVLQPFGGWLICVSIESVGHSAEHLGQGPQAQDQESKGMQKATSSNADRPPLPGGKVFPRNIVAVTTTTTTACICAGNSCHCQHKLWLYISHISV